MPLISDEKIYLKDNDRHVLGEVGYHLVRLSCVLGHIAEVPHSIMSPDMPLNLGQLARLLNGELDRIRETAELALNHDALLNLAYWYVHHYLANLGIQDCWFYRTRPMFIKPLVLYIVGSYLRQRK
jgi:hypothetical protein